MSITDAMRELSDLIKKAYTIYESTASWQCKYSLVFSDEIAGGIRRILQAYSLRMEWYDPDMDYEDDVRAYVSALRGLQQELGNMLPLNEELMDD